MEESWQETLRTLVANGSAAAARAARLLDAAARAANEIALRLDERQHDIGETPSPRDGGVVVEFARRPRACSPGHEGAARDDPV
jgi:hypothetical protein